MQTYFIWSKGSIIKSFIYYLLINENKCCFFIVMKFKFRILIIMVFLISI